MSFQKFAVITSLVLIIGGGILFVAFSGRQESAIKGTPSTVPISPVTTLPLPSSPSSEQRTALVIGNSAYAGDSFLTNPVNDAKALATVLRQLHFDVFDHTNLNREQMKAAIREFSGQLAEKPGVGLFYYSGHGLQYQGVNYLIPLGANAGLKAVYDLPDETVTMDYVLSAMKTVENKVNLLILDACRNPPRFVKSWHKGDMIPPGLALPQRTPGASLIAYAAASGKVALSGEGQNLSPYVNALIKWMQVPNLSVTDALTQVRTEVIEATHQMQEPEFSVALNQPFYFNWDAKAEQARQAEHDRLDESLKQKQAELEAMRREQARLQAELELARQPASVPALPSDETAPKAVSGKYRLTVLATPADSRVRLMNIQPKYVSGIALEPGDYELLVDQAGYVASRQWITIVDQDITLPVVLEQQSAQIFRDRLQEGSQGPEMVWIPAGSFRMGDVQGGGESDEKPVHSVSVKRFAMGRYEVTFAEYDKFAEATGRAKPDDEGWGRSNRPVINVSWTDATAYAQWLSQQTGQTYRLPTEAEWEYAARAGTETTRYWENNLDEACRYANVRDKTLKKELDSSSIHNCADGYVYTAPVGRFKPNAFDLFDMLGNVWEWTCSEYENPYNGKENKCISQESGGLRALRGGAWFNVPRYVRAAYRHRSAHDYRYDDVGFRLARRP